MEEDVSGTSFPENPAESPHSSFTAYLDEICPYYLTYGMTWYEFWNESIDRYAAYWQKHQYEIEKRNQELWMQGLYIRQAIDSAFDTKHRCKYPERPHRITEMSDVEKEIETKRKVEAMREQLMEIKRRSDARNKSKGGG